mmetsp:Transcript_3369/g.9409  ORF Transcript_3369/g.9409 Transcript_3369/m.9409 type:complete len:345 (-) Transcript_3369:474-1508(-)
MLRRFFQKGAQFPCGFSGSSNPGHVRPHAGGSSAIPALGKPVPVFHVVAPADATRIQIAIGPRVKLKVGPILLLGAKQRRWLSNDSFPFPTRVPPDHVSALNPRDRPGLVRKPKPRRHECGPNPHRDQDVRATNELLALSVRELDPDRLGLEILPDLGKLDALGAPKDDLAALLLSSLRELGRDLQRSHLRRVAVQQLRLSDVAVEPTPHAQPLLAPATRNTQSVDLPERLQAELLRQLLVHPEGLRVECTRGTITPIPCQESSSLSRCCRPNTLELNNGATTTSLGQLVRRGGSLDPSTQYHNMPLPRHSLSSLGHHDHRLRGPHILLLLLLSDTNANRTSRC